MQLPFATYRIASFMLAVAQALNLY